MYLTGIFPHPFLGSETKSGNEIDTKLLAFKVLDFVAANDGVEIVALTTTKVVTTARILESGFNWVMPKVSILSSQPASEPSINDVPGYPGRRRLGYRSTLKIFQLECIKTGRLSGDGHARLQKSSLLIKLRLIILAIRPRWLNLKELNMKNRKHVLAVAGLVFMGLLSPVTSFAADTPTATTADPNAFDTSQAVKKAKVKGCAIKVKGNCSKKKMAGFDFSGLDLTGMNFSGSDLTKADFSEATIDKANFNGANLTGADLSDVQSAKGANFTNAAMRGVNMDSGNFDGANFGKAKASRANLANATFVRANGANVDFSYAILEATDFSQASFKNANFSNATGADPVFENAQFPGANFKGSKMTAPVFSGANLAGSDMTSSLIRPADLDESDYCGATLYDGFTADDDCSNA